MSVSIHHGDSREVLKTFAEASIDSVVCDPPYALVSIGKRFGAEDAAPCKASKTGAYARASAGFMGKKWDTGETAFDPAFWAEVLRVLKPGGHLIAFGGTRTYHRLACAIEDGGFEIRDQIQWLYGSGFAKSHNLRGDWEGWGSALKPANEPIVLARRPLAKGLTIAANVLAHGTGALNIDASRIGTGGGTAGAGAGAGAGAIIFGNGLNGKRGEPVPGLGRWPANVIHDGSDEVVGAFPAGGGNDKRTGIEPGQRPGGSNVGSSTPNGALYGDFGSAARFFYSAKADAADRCGSRHPTVKPVDLMAYLCRLVTPPRVVEFVCESCSNPPLGQVPSGDLQAKAPALQNVRDANQQAQGEVLLARVPGRGDEGGGSDATPAPLQELRSDLQTDERRRAAILLAEVCGDGDRPAETQGADQDRDRILAGLQAGPSDGVESGLHHGASLDRVGIDREAAEAVRGRSPRKRGQGRQSPREPRADEQARTRPGAEDAKESGSQMSPLSGLNPALTRIERPGRVLDPFAGSGSTGMACLREGFDCILIEREAEYVADIHRRIAHVGGGGTPLFAGEAAMTGRPLHRLHRPLAGGGAACSIAPDTPTRR